MDIFVISRFLKDTEDKLVAVSARGSRGDIYFQEFVICSPNKEKEQFTLIFANAIKYINETLIAEKGYSIRRLSVVGDIHLLPFNEYAWKRSSGCFHDLSKCLKRGSVLHDICKELYEYIKKMKGVEVSYGDWGHSNGYMWSSHKSIRDELGKLAGDLYYDEDKELREFLKWNS